MHPLVLELTGKKTPQVGLEGKFSVYHSSAVALLYGAAGEKEYSDACVRDPKVIALRDRVDCAIDNALRDDEMPCARHAQGRPRVQEICRARHRQPRAAR